MANYKITIENIRGDEIRDKPYGEGTSYSPYKISSAENLVYMSEHPDIWANKYFRQTNNIDLDGVNWIPINGDNVATSINYNGNNYTISNLTINNIDNRYVGFFGILHNDSIISNLIIENCNILDERSAPGTTFIGAIAGYTNYNTSIINCTIKNSSITSLLSNGSPYIGGLVGRCEQANISSCIVENSTFLSNNYVRYSLVGGLIGYGSGNINNCASLGNLVQGGRCGGAISSLSNHPNTNNNINNCYSTSTVQSSINPSDTSAGGFISRCDTRNTTITNCYSNGLVINNGITKIGGFTGYESSIYPPIINNCFWDTETSNQSTSACGIGKTSAQFAQQSTFTDWDFTDVWEMGTSYPILQFEAFAIEKETEVFEYPFPYKILKNTTEYDPFSYISYDYMISTSRTAKFDAFIDDYFDDETFDFINNLTRVGYKKKIDENNGKYDNDITLYNHFYYSTEDDEDEFVRIELDDNTIEHKIGKEIEDKYGELRTVSSREIITEGVSTLMCRIYELTTDNERLVYSGLIDKRETKFDGTKLSVSLIDMMGLYVELSEKYTKTVNDFGEIGFNAVDLKSAVKTFVYFLSENININNKYLPSVYEINENVEYISSISNHRVNKFIGTLSSPYQNGYSAEYFLNNSSSKEFSFGTFIKTYNSSINALKFFMYIEYSITDTGALELSLRDIDDYSTLSDFDISNENSNDNNVIILNKSGKSYRIIRRNDAVNTELSYEDYYTSGANDSLNVNILNVIIEYVDRDNGDYSKIRPIFNLGSITSSQDASIVFAFQKYNTSTTYEINIEKEDSFEVYTGGSTSESSLLNWFNYVIKKYYSELNNKLKAFEAWINDYMCSDIIRFINDDITYSIIEDDNISTMEKLDNVINVNPLLYNINTEDYYYNYGDMLTKKSFSYLNVIPMYPSEYSLFDLTKLFSLICYNKILTKDTGEMYFDKESYNENNGYIYIDKSNIINNYKQESMIGDDEEFNVLDDVYVGTGGTKIAYKRLETSTKENYKKLYENNNMKVSFNLRNHIYDIKSNLTTTIDQREIEPKDVIRIMHNGYEKIRVFVTSVKFINNNTEIEIEGITLQTRNITVSHLKSDSK